MKAKFLNLFLPGIMLLGRTQRHIVGSVGSPTFSSLKERALRQKGEVTLVDGQKYAAARIRIGQIQPHGSILNYR